MHLARNRRAAGMAWTLVLMVALTVLLGSSWELQSHAESLDLAERQRFGFVATSTNWRKDFDSPLLGAGWAVDFSQPACGTRPGAVDLAMGLGLHAESEVDPNRLGPLVDAHPRVIWLLGNEPDCIHQGNIVPEEYARIYHDFYTFIKGRDPTSLVAPGGIVQATPLRFEWLNRVLLAYQQAYGTKMPVDVWNIHNAIVNEQRGEWGADIPPGIDAEEGRVLSFYENDNMEIFEQQIWDFRAWMAANGYRGLPLIISEYGVLMPEELGFWPWKVNAFMDASFDFLQTASDPYLGDPSDGYRLVQRWAWFSLDFPLYDATIHYGFNGGLFDSKTGLITEYGLNFAEETSALAPLYHTDLAMGPVWPSPLFRAIPPGETITRTMYIRVFNNGNQASGSFAVHFGVTGPVNLTFDRLVSSMPAHSSSVIEFTLANLPVGHYEIVAELDPEDLVIESAECNNRASRLLMVPTHIQIMPFIGR